MPERSERTCLLTEVRIRPNSKKAFADWQSKLNTDIAAFPGFLSLEFLAAANDSNWMINQRFVNETSTLSWKESDQRKKLLNELKPFLIDNGNAFKEDLSDGIGQRGGVTEVFVTSVSPQNVESFRKWMAKIHQVEATFPGFRGCYVQSPSRGQSNNWITLLQFDTVDNLERWLSSSERKKVLEDSQPVVESLESHRVISPYAGWFASVSQGGQAPAAWKQAMIVLLVLFPIVMLEMKFLNPFLVGMNKSLATFIGNAISVGLVTWPLTPITIRYLKWWLVPPANKQQEYTLYGTIIVCALFLVEIVALWWLL